MYLGFFRQGDIVVILLEDIALQNFEQQVIRLFPFDTHAYRPYYGT